MPTDRWWVCSELRLNGVLVILLEFYCSSGVACPVSKALYCPTATPFALGPHTCWMASSLPIPPPEPFLKPVDWKAWGLHDYPQIVKVPMDLSKVEVRIVRCCGAAC